jgi:hypothetical protein
MATLFNTKISATYEGLLKTIDNAAISATLRELTDGSGNQSGLFLNTSGDFKVTSVLEWGSLKDTGTGVTITQFVTAANGIENFNNDTTLPTSAAVKLYVDTKFATSDTLQEVLSFGNTTSGNNIVVSASDDITFTDSSKALFGSSQDLEINHNGTDSFVTDLGTGDLRLRSDNSVKIQASTGGNNLATFTKGSGVDLYFNNAKKLETTNTGISVTGIISNLTNPIDAQDAATKSYVDALDAGSDLDITDGTTTGDVNLNTQTLSILGTTNEIETVVSGQGVTIGLPSSISTDLVGNVTGNLTGNVTGDLTGNVTSTSVLANGVTATTQASNDDSTKVATTAYVKGLDNASDLDFSGDSGSGDVNLNTQTLAVTGTTNQIESTASNQGLNLKFPTAGVTLPNGSLATTQSAGDNSTKISTTQYVDSSAALYLPLAGGTMSGNTIHNDNVKSVYGTGSDAQVYHDGSNFYANNTTGQLNIDQSAVTQSIVFKVSNANALDTTALIINREGDLITGKDVTIAGDLTVNGTTTTVNSQTLSVDDPLISLAINNAANSLDIGYYGKYNDGTTRYLGLFNDASDSNKFKLFRGTTVEPTTTVNIGGAGYLAADLVVAGLEGTSVVSTGSIIAASGNSGQITLSANSIGSTNNLVISTAGGGSNIEMYNTEMYFDGNTQYFRPANASSTYLTLNSTSATFAGDVTIETGIDLESGTLVIKNSTGDASGLKIFQDSSDASKIYNNYNGTLQLGTNNVTRLTIDSTSATFAGDVIVQGTSAAGYVKLSGDGNGAIYTSNGDMQFFTNNSAYATKFYSANKGSTLVTILDNGTTTFAGNVNTGRLFVEQSGADIIDMTRTGVGTYRFAISGSDAFSLFDVGANADRLTIDTSGNATFTGDVTLTGTGDKILDIYRDGGSGHSIRLHSEGVSWIDNNNNFGIGTDSPLGKLQVTLPAYDNEDTNSQQAIFGVDNGGGLRIGYNETSNKGYINVLKPAVAWGSLVLQSGGGKVGVGTTTPTGDLSVGSTTTSSGDIHLRTSKTTVTLTPSNVAGGGFNIDTGFVSGGQGPMTLSIGGAERMRITSAGNLQLKGTTPTLDFFKTSAGDVLANIKVESGAGTGGKFTIQTKRNGNTALDALVINESQTVGIGSTGIYAGTNASLNLPGIGLAIKNDLNGSSNNWSYITNTDTASSANLNFHTGNNASALTLSHSGDATFGSSVTINGEGDTLTLSKSNNLPVLRFKGAGTDAALIEGGNFLNFYVGGTSKFKIESSGAVNIGYIGTLGGFGTEDVSGIFYSGGNTGGYTAINSNSNNAPLYLARGASTPTGILINMASNGTGVGSISITGSATAYNTSSDYRLKEDLQDFAGLDMVSKIPVYDFKWKTDESRTYGVMAHELQEVLPNAVTGQKDADEMQSVDYSKIVPLLIKSIQELTAKIERLEAK